MKQETPSHLDDEKGLNVSLPLSSLPDSVSRLAACRKIGAGVGTRNRVASIGVAVASSGQSLGHSG